MALDDLPPSHGASTPFWELVMMLQPVTTNVALDVKEINPTVQSSRYPCARQ